MRIGELGQAIGVGIETIRHYENTGLLPSPARAPNGYRVYGREHLERLAFIRRCRALDMTLDEIRVLLRFRDTPTEDCEAVNVLLDARINHVAARIDELKRLQEQLIGLRRQCGASRQTRDCGILNTLLREGVRQ